jgi:hypothetical protein
MSKPENITRVSVGKNEIIYWSGTQLMEKTIQDVIQTILTAIPGTPYPDTVDVVKIHDSV